MLTYPVIDPVILRVGPVALHWYGLMYVLGFAGAYWLALRQMTHGRAPIGSQQDVEDLIFQGAMGVVLGGRIGYVLFYQFSTFLHDPLFLFRITQGGMSFHGGLIGVLVAMTWFARQRRLHFFTVTDFIAPLVPIGLGFGRIGNFINQELWGRPTDLPWGMVFPLDPAGLARHPSQLYQAMLEGVLLFVLLQWLARKPRATGVVSGWFLMLYATLRFSVEFLREPDAHIGFEWLGWMTRGQELCLPMFVAGLVIYCIAVRHRRREA